MKDTIAIAKTLGLTVEQYLQVLEGMEDLSIVQLCKIQAGITAIIAKKSEE